MSKSTNEQTWTTIPRVIIALFFLLPSISIGADYASGHQALQVWDSHAQENMPQWIRYWLMVMISIYVLGLLFIRRHQESRWLVGGVITSLLVSKFVIPALGMIPLSGLVALLHVIFWSPALYLLLKNRPFLEEISAYSIWSATATACILFSFIFDIRDAAIYLVHVSGL